MIINKIKKNLEAFLQENNFVANSIKLDKSKNLKFGDFSCNILLLLSSQFIKANQAFDLKFWADKIINNLEFLTEIKKIDLHPSGFLNIYLNHHAINELSKKINLLKENFGHQPPKNKTYFIELVSANPTGYLHIGHARNGVFGDILSNLLKTAGYQTFNEYLINDAGNQVKNLAFAVFVRYLNLCNVPASLPEDSYHGEDIKFCAQDFFNLYNEKYKNILYEDNKFKNPNDLKIFLDFALNYFLNNIQKDLNDYQIHIDNWFSEQSMHNDGSIQKLISLLENDIYVKDKAKWFAASKYIANNKDEVLVKSDQQTITYYAQDIAYHKKKLEQFGENSQLINIFGADHHGHIIRLQAFFKALKYNDDKVIFLITQLVRIIKDGQEVKMSKRTGQTLTMRDMYDLVGYNSLRWCLVSQSINSHVDINLNQLEETGAANQIYYVLYAYARIWQILLKNEDNYFESNFDLLTNDDEKNLINQILFYEETIIGAAQFFEPHRICNYLYDLAKFLHVYYNNHKILSLNDQEMKKQKLHLLFLVQQIIFNGLAILKIKPEKQM